MQLFRTESSDHSQKLLPRAAPIAGWITLTYVVLTLVWATALWLAGMSKFDAVCHAMTTIATGGFSTSDGSIGHFNKAAIDWIIIVGMLVGGMPFILYLRAVRGDLAALVRDSQVQWFIGFCIVSSLIMTAWLCYHMEAPPLIAIRYAAFNTVSVITGTGYITAPYDQWGSFAVTVLFFLMFVGGCTGSTTGGIKVFRYQVLLNSARIELTRLIRPHVVMTPRFNGEPIPSGIANAVRSFFFVFFAGFIVTALALGLHGYDFITSTSGAATAIANVGPGLGPLIGPANNFASLSDTATWLLSAAMLLGRLELFTVLVLFIPSFWRE
jgi:trk system potassium uptake protein TrkH